MNSSEICKTRRQCNKKCFCISYTYSSCVSVVFVPFALANLLTKDLFMFRIWMWRFLSLAMKICHCVTLKGHWGTKWKNIAELKILACVDWQICKARYVWSHRMRNRNIYYIITAVNMPYDLNKVLSALRR